MAIGLVLCDHGFLPLANLPNHPIASRIIGIGRLTWSGVDLFFVLSGFLIGGILLDAIESMRYFAPFYIRRADALGLGVAAALIARSPLGYPSAWLHPCSARLRFARHDHCSFQQLDNQRIIPL